MEIKTLEDVKNILKDYEGHIDEAYELFRSGEVGKVPHKVSEQFYNQYGITPDGEELTPFQAFTRLYMEVHGGIKC